MRKVPRFETTDTVVRQKFSYVLENERIQTLINDLQGIRRLLGHEIKVEEERARNSDPAHYAYPFTARAMTSRQENLRAATARRVRRCRLVSTTG
jgi:hypothetical protein